MIMQGDMYIVTRCAYHGMSIFPIEENQLSIEDESLFFFFGGGGTAVGALDVVVLDRSLQRYDLFLFFFPSNTTCCFFGLIADGGGVDLINEVWLALLLSVLNGDWGR